MLKLSFDKLPTYINACERKFLPNEKHINRKYNKDVLILMHSGVLRFSEDGIPVELKAGEYYIQRAGLSQTGEIESDSPSYLYIHFLGEFSEDGTLPIRGKFSQDSIDKHIQSLKMLGIQASHLEYSASFYSILAALSREQKQVTDAEKLKTYLINNYQWDVPLKELATTISRSVNQAINIFKAAYGTTPHQYLMEYRLDKACELIMNTNKPINKISSYVGIKNYTIFYRMFQARYGISPSEYRNQNRSTEE